MAMVTVGQTSISIPWAQESIATYTDPARQHGKKPFAYPGYDALDTGSGASELNDGDLLAPALLNVRPSMSAFYRLQAIRSDLMTAMQPDADLADLTDDEVEARVAPVYAVLDSELRDHAGYGLSGTTLSKVLHRKRPGHLCLHDRWIRKAYLGSARLPQAKQRSWASYMTLLSQAMAHDLRQQRDAFQLLHRSVHGQAVSDLRLLDIVVWSSQGESRT